MRNFYRIGSALAAALFLFAAAGIATAQDFPNKTVRIIVPYPPGGSAEAQARLLAQKLSETWGQPVIVESKPGAGTTIGAAYVASSPPDGYTLYLAGTTSHLPSAILFRKSIKYDALKSFAGVSLVASSPFILAVNPSVLPANSVKEYIDLAKAKPNTITYASSGNGAGPHLAGVLLQMLTGIKLVHVPFKGSAPATVALLGGQVQSQMADVSVLPQLEGGKLRALAVTSATRSPLIPNLPTIAESGVPGYDVTYLSAILAPAGTPKAIVDQINAAINKALTSPDVRQRFNAQGFEPTGSTPEALDQLLASEMVKYEKVIKESGMKID
ncbi:MAG: tripartite tricarboxylate transporter substrate binding protein [Burkholderiales bacterium]